MDNSYEKIKIFFDYVEHTFNTKITIKDFVGFIPMNKGLDLILQPYFSHTNPYCMYIKSDNCNYGKCLEQKKKIFCRLQKEKKPFCGMCYAGIVEYIIPIEISDILVGSIHLSFFNYHPQKALQRLKRICHPSSVLDYNKAYELYITSITFSSLPTSILPFFEIIAQLLSLSLKPILSSNFISNRNYLSSEDTILSDSINYIKQHFNEDIKISQIASYCHCSESYLSHIFNNRNGFNINTYINKVRIEEAKKIFEKCNLTVSEVSALCGFNNPNYFSKVFSQYVTYSPSKYKAAFHKKSS